MEWEKNYSRICVELSTFQKHPNFACFFHNIITRPFSISAFIAVIVHHRRGNLFTFMWFWNQLNMGMARWHSLSKTWVNLGVVKIDWFSHNAGYNFFTIPLHTIITTLINEVSPHQFSLPILCYNRCGRVMNRLR